MVEGEADLIPEDVFVDALKFAHEDIKKIIALQEEIAKEVNPEKRDIPEEKTNEKLSTAVDKALGDRSGITRFGSAYIPMDETLSRVAMDISARPYLIWRVNFSKPKLGEMDTELFKEWFQGFAQAAGITLHVENLYGENNHHIVESCFKGLARSLRAASSMDMRNEGSVPSTKGVLGERR